MYPKLIFDESSNTIRQMPENYLIAQCINNQWLCTPDLATNKELATRVFIALFDFETKYSNGNNLLSKVLKIENKVFLTIIN